MSLTMEVLRSRIAGLPDFDTSMDTQINTSVNIALSVCENYCDRKFTYKSDEIEKFINIRSSTVSLKRYPIESIDGIADKHSSWHGDHGAEFDADSGIVFWEHTMCRRSLSVQYSGGYRPEDFPADLGEIIIYLATNFFHEVMASVPPPGYLPTPPPPQLPSPPPDPDAAVASVIVPDNATTPDDWTPTTLVYEIPTQTYTGTIFKPLGTLAESDSLATWIVFFADLYATPRNVSELVTPIKYGRAAPLSGSFTEAQTKEAGPFTFLMETFLWEMMSAMSHVHQQGHKNKGLADTGVLAIRSIFSIDASKWQNTPDYVKQYGYKLGQYTNPIHGPGEEWRKTYQTFNCRLAEAMAVGIWQAAPSGSGAGARAAFLLKYMNSPPGPVDEFSLRPNPQQHDAELILAAGHATPYVYVFPTNTAEGKINIRHHWDGFLLDPLNPISPQVAAASIVTDVEFSNFNPPTSDYFPRFIEKYIKDYGLADIRSQDTGQLDNKIFIDLLDKWVEKAFGVDPTATVPTYLHDVAVAYATITTTHSNPSALDKGARIARYAVTSAFLKRIWATTQGADKSKRAAIVLKMADYLQYDKDSIPLGLAELAKSATVIPVQPVVPYHPNLPAKVLAIIGAFMGALNPQPSKQIAESITRAVEALFKADTDPTKVVGWLKTEATNKSLKGVDVAGAAADLILNPAKPTEPDLTGLPKAILDAFFNLATPQLTPAELATLKADATLARNHDTRTDANQQLITLLHSEALKVAPTADFDAAVAAANLILHPLINIPVKPTVPGGGGGGGTLPDAGAGEPSHLFANLPVKKVQLTGVGTIEFESDGSGHDHMFGGDFLVPKYLMLILNYYRRRLV